MAETELARPPWWIEDRYRADREIGRGSFGRVYEGFDVRLQRRVAIKVLRGYGQLPRRATDAYLAEARLAAAAGSAGVVVYDAVAGTNEVAIIMELLTRGSLDRVVSRSRTVDAWALALAFVGALERVHEHGLLHLDLHPANVLVRDDESIAIADFGLAQLARSAGVSRAAHEVMWTAPEVLSGGQPTPQADVYAAGLILGWLDRRVGLGIRTVVDHATDELAERRYQDGAALHIALRDARMPPTPGRI